MTKVERRNKGRKDSKEGPGAEVRHILCGEREREKRDHI